MYTREEVEAQERRDDLWVRWTGTGGTFEIIRNGGFPVFPLTRKEKKWLSDQIGEIYDLGEFTL